MTLPMALLFVVVQITEYNASLKLGLQK